MAAPPYMKLYVADWTADTQALTCEQDGAYWRIVRAMWRAGGTLANDPKTLALIVGLSEARWALLGEDVLALFVRRGAMLTHRRIRSEAKKYRETVAQRASAGRAGGVQSGLNRRKSKAESGEANARGTPSKRPHNQTQNQSHKTKKAAPSEQSLLGPARPPARAEGAAVLAPEELARRKAVGAMMAELARDLRRAH